MFGFINTNAPFRNLKLTRCGILELISLHRHSRVLTFAEEVHWNYGPRRGHHHSTSASTMVGQTIRFIFSTLQTSTTLRLLEIFRLQVGSSHQMIILAVPTLRELILNQSWFAPSAAKMPSSSITTLSFVPGAIPPAQAAHILGLLSESLESLDIGYSPRAVYSTLSSMQFPRLVSFRHTCLNALTVLTSHLTITKLHISVLITPQRLDLHAGILPWLRDLSSPWWIAAQLVPGRPVQVFSDTGERVMKLGDGLFGLDTKLLALAQSTCGIDELQISRPFSVGLFVLLAKHLPQLKRFKLWTTTDTLWAPPEVGRGATWNQFQQCPAAITDIEIRFQRPMGPPSSQISHSFCHLALELVAQACPALKLATFAALDSKELDIEEREIPRAWKFKAYRTLTGAWEKLLTASEGDWEPSFLDVVPWSSHYVCE
jgi:hypothetical protein